MSDHNAKTTMDAAIVIRNATKRFRKSTIRQTHTTLKSEFLKWLRGTRQPSPESWIDALRGIDLTIPKGKTVGIIGRNGAGKSTLLKLMTGIYAPTSGTIEVRGRVSALLELGAGFHPDFSGRENILINGIILGMSRAEVRARMSEIIEFSELGDFIDEPVRTYSSGMYTRLAFSVATYVDPDILIIDEILAVGDEHFFRKSRGRMDQFKRAGKTIILVTHALGTVQEWCDLAAWIDEGLLRRMGDPREVVNEYVQAVALSEQQQPPRSVGLGTTTYDASAEKTISDVSAAPSESAGPSIQIERVRFIDVGGREIQSIDTEDSLEISIEYVSREPPSDVGFGLSLIKGGGTEVFTTDTFVESVSLPHPLPEAGTVRVKIIRLGLTDGTYFVDVFVRSRDGVTYDQRQGRYSFQVRSGIRDRGVTRPPHQWIVEPRQRPV